MRTQPTRGAPKRSDVPRRTAPSTPTQPPPRRGAITTPTPSLVRRGSALDDTCAPAPTRRAPMPSHPPDSAVRDATPRIAARGRRRRRRCVVYGDPPIRRRCCAPAVLERSPAQVGGGRAARDRSRCHVPTRGPRSRTLDRILGTACSRLATSPRRHEALIAAQRPQGVVTHVLLAAEFELLQRAGGVRYETRRSCGMAPGVPVEPVEYARLARGAKSKRLAMVALARWHAAEAGLKAICGASAAHHAGPDRRTRSGSSPEPSTATNPLTRPRGGR